MSSYGVYSRNKTRIDRAIVSPRSHRGVSAPSLCDGAIRLGTPTFKLACLKDKAGLTRRAQRSQRRSVFSRVNTRFMFPLCSLRSLCETIFYFSKTYRTKVRRSQAFPGVPERIAPSRKEGARTPRGLYELKTCDRFWSCFLITPHNLTGAVVLGNTIL